MLEVVLTQILMKNILCNIHSKCTDNVKKTIQINTEHINRINLQIYNEPFASVFAYIFVNILVKLNTCYCIALNQTQQRTSKLENPKLVKKAIQLF